MTNTFVSQRLWRTMQGALDSLSARVSVAVNRVGRRVADGPNDRGDVPGWVLVTIMTAGLVVALWAIAGPKLGQLFTGAVDSVKGP
jgi:hypothetical protein